MKKQKLTLLKFCFAAFASVLFLALATNVHASYERPPEVKVFDGQKQYEAFVAYDPSFTGGVQVASGDVNGDGVDEVITAPGKGGAPHIRIFTSNGKLLGSFFSYDLNMRAGVNIAAGDLNGDGKDEIVTAPREGGSPHVRIFDSQGDLQFSPGFFAYHETFRGGATVSVGDLDGNGSNEIITGAGTGGAPHVRIFDRTGNVLGSFFPFHPEFRGGINVAVANLDGGNDDELLVSVASSDSAWVKVVKKNGHEHVVSHFMAYGEEFHGGVTVAGGDLNGDGIDEIIVGASSSGGPHVRTFNGNGESTPTSLFAYEQDFRGGINVAAGNINGSDHDEIVIGPSKWLPTTREDFSRYVEVSLTDQRLYAYEYGRLVKTFLVSTGLRGMDTRTGTFYVSQKIPVKLYSGPGYYLPNTKWNLRFDGSRLLHGAYWHNDFGRRKSHGCVNISYPNAEWLYNWAPVGTTVLVRN
ncbi:MAG: hypothetical protein A2898_04105 [Candidatus Kerfeldbacteria bacterium RIFCSPLOWO2_01_FULL_48_11]|uniref:L,D-TPase catalytic domain-containing protein n=1 Tax=Candidatus Kerfeldbacteria bacterium RIFCSPLOWO2_01_FULL_48_11 TaxID=1798543 RepID=A0A1G2B0N8_9BACT|nr:MAG: FG-GAP repeat protein [Parcubacteria group bacterium GW2011_GWA2_48_9]KKW16339.1 MAG: FG-GAP repeat protein [Parcubacteria group bacterium GW2011_GWC2_49_9]OGY82752.1 MAG: hypothetical protein A2898_04105 [Candidatus Kerfeldbacteria bacterium RIFCSPLOWO2_01_FULL_48_11]HCJ52631.1 hypothetical protein [Candidatus Kerfeldbacteria bacterium]